MSKEIKVALITGILGLIGVIISYGKGKEIGINIDNSIDLSVIMERLESLEYENKILKEQQNNSVSDTGGTSSTFESASQFTSEHTSGSFVKTVPPYAVSSEKHVTTQKNVTMGGTIYDEAINYDRGGTWDGNSRYSLHNLNGQYTMLFGYIGHIDESKMHDATFNFYKDDGKVLASYDLTAQDLPFYISLDVTDVKQLKIEVVHSANETYKGAPYNSQYAFADAFLE